MMPKVFRAISIGVSAGSLIFGLATASLSQSASKPAPMTNAERLRALTSFGFDDLMTMLIQPRHLKLYYAGNQKNWELAAAEMRDLRSAFLRITIANPRYLNNDVDSAIAAIMSPTMNAMDAAIATGGSKEFEKAYVELTTACNACHAYMEHPFLVIKVPDSGAAAPYADQDFSTQR